MPDTADHADYVAIGWMCENGEHLRRVAWQRHTILTKPWCDSCFEVYRRAAQIDGDDRGSE